MLLGSLVSTGGFVRVDRGGTTVGVIRVGNSRQFEGRFGGRFEMNFTLKWLANC